MKKRGFHIDEFLYAHLLLNGFTRHEAKVQGITLHWLQKSPKSSSKNSKKKWVILIHGIASTSSHWGRTAIDLVKRGYSVLALDLPCHGRSADPFDLDLKERTTCTPEYFFSLFTDWMTKIAPEITADRYHLVGNSLGGGMCLRFALEYPDFLKNLVLISPAGGFESKKQWDSFRKEMEFNRKPPKKINETSDHARARNYIERIYHKPPIYTFALTRPFVKALSGGGLREMVALSEFDSASLFSENNVRTLEVSTLIIWGKSEKLFPYSHLENFKKRLKVKAPRSRTGVDVLTITIEEPEGVGHVPQLEQPLWLSHRLDSFIQTEA